MVHQRLPDKFVQFVRDRVVNIDCNMLVIVLPMFRLICARAFSLSPSLSLSLSHEHESLNVLWYLKDVFLRRHVGLGILEEAFRSQTSEWKNV